MANQAGDRAVNGDFHVIKMDGLFHVVFRPDADPEWFRIIGSFYTYERAWSYCDIERVSVWSYTDSESGETSGESYTGDEELGGLRSPPVDPIPEGWMASRDGCAEMVRNVFPEIAAIVPPLPDEDFSDQPEEDERPKDYHRRVQEEAAAAICRAADALPIEPEPESEPDPYAEAMKELPDNQWSVLQTFIARAKQGEPISASMKDLAVQSGVSQGSMPYFIKSLEKKGFIEIVELGNATASGSYRVIDPSKREIKEPCVTCGGPRSPGAARQCRACYQSTLTKPETVS